MTSACGAGRIDSLLSSVTIPFNLLFVVRVWADTPDGIAAKALAMRTALQGIDGAEFLQVNNAAQARHLFYETFPATSGATIAGWDIYVENHNLADLMPISSTFTGHLEEAQALYDSPGRSVVGVRLVAANGTPQHSIVVGVNGSGKSALLIDLMSQIGLRLVVPVLPGGGDGIRHPGPAMRDEKPGAARIGRQHAQSF